MSPDLQSNQAPGIPRSDEDDYYQVVEKHFVGLRGSPLFITPKEWQLIHDWRRMRIPLRIVLDGLDRVFERRKSARSVRHLSYCRQAVEAAYRRHCEALAGGENREVGGAPGEEAAPIERYLLELQERLRETARSLADSQPELARRTEQAADLLGERAARPLGEDGFSGLENELARLEADIVEAAEAGLEKADQRRLMEDARHSLSEYRERMPREVYESALRSSYLKRIRAQFGLPPMSLFYL